MLALSQVVKPLHLLCSPFLVQVLPAGQQLTVMGFGMTEYGDLSDRLM